MSRGSADALEVEVRRHATAESLEIFPWGTHGISMGRSIAQWIGFLGKIYRKTPYSMGKNRWFPVKIFPRKPIHWIAVSPIAGWFISWKIRVTWMILGVAAFWESSWNYWAVMAIFSLHGIELANLIHPTDDPILDWLYNYMWIVFVYM